MRDHHGHQHQHGINRDGNKKALSIALIITFSIMIMEFIGGLITNSLALLSDAGHMLSDSSSLVGSVGAIIAGALMLFFEWYIADSIISVVVALLILKSAWGVFKIIVNALVVCFYVLYFELLRKCPLDFLSYTVCLTSLKFRLYE